MAAPSFIDVTTVAVNTGSSVTVNYSGLSSIQDGDILFLFAVNSQIGVSVGSISAPGDWVSIQNPAAFRNNVSQLNGTMAVYYKIANGTETGSVECNRTGDTGGDFLACICQFRGIKVVLGNHSTNQESSSATITWNEVTFSGAEGTAIGFGGELSDTMDTPSGYTAAISSGSAAHISIDYKEDVVSVPSVTASGGSSDGWATVHLVIFNALGRSFIVN